MRALSFFNRIARRAVSRLLVGIAVGSVSWTTAGLAEWPFHKEEKPGKPDKIIALWNDTVLTQPDQPAIRGFGDGLKSMRARRRNRSRSRGPWWSTPSTRAVAVPTTRSPT